MPPGGVPGPLTNENVPVLLVGSVVHAPFGARSPLLTPVVVVAAAAGVAVRPASPAPTTQTMATAHTLRCSDRLVAAVGGRRRLIFSPFGNANGAMREDPPLPPVARNVTAA